MIGIGWDFFIGVFVGLCIMYAYRLETIHILRQELWHCRAERELYQKLYRDVKSCECQGDEGEICYDASVTLYVAPGQAIDAFVIDDTAMPVFDDFGTTQGLVATEGNYGR